MRLGVFGGSFDPIHFGHLRAAEVARERLELDQVLFVPNHVSPFKTDRPPTPGRLRAQMIAAAIDGHPQFALWTGEIDRPPPSFTVDSLRQIQAQDPTAALFFLTGTDAVKALPEWRDPETLLALARFVAIARPGVDEQAVRQALPDRWARCIDFIAVSGLDISATEIRHLVRHGRSLRYLTPPGVIAIVEEHGLYRTEDL